MKPLINNKFLIGISAFAVLVVVAAFAAKYSENLPATVVVSPTPLTLTGKIKATKLKQGTNTLEFEGKTKLGKTVGAVVNFYVGSPSPTVFPKCTCSNPQGDDFDQESGGPLYCSGQGYCIP